VTSIPTLTVISLEICQDRFPVNLSNLEVVGKLATRRAEAAVNEILKGVSGLINPNTASRRLYPFIIINVGSILNLE